MMDDLVTKLLSPVAKAHDEFASLIESLGRLGMPLGKIIL